MVLILRLECRNGTVTVLNYVSTTVLLENLVLLRVQFHIINGNIPVQWGSQTIPEEVYSISVERKSTCEFIFEWQKVGT